MTFEKTKMKLATLKAFGLILDRRIEYSDLRAPIYLIHKPPLKFNFTEETPLEEPVVKKARFEWFGDYQDKDDHFPLFEFVGLE